MHASLATLEARSCVEIRRWILTESTNQLGAICYTIDSYGATLASLPSDRGGGSGAFPPECAPLHSLHTAAVDTLDPVHALEGQA
jgi:hypothetical protein